jgi:hypothetical protein
MTMDDLTFRNTLAVVDYFACCRSCEDVSQNKHDEDITMGPGCRIFLLLGMSSAFATNLSIGAS